MIEYIVIFVIAFGLGCVVGNNKKSIEPKENKDQDIIIDTEGIDKTIIDATTQHGGSSLAYGDKKKLAIAHATYFLKEQD